MNEDLLRKYKPGKISRTKTLLWNPVKRLSTPQLTECWTNFTQMPKAEPDDFEAAYYVLKELNRREQKRQALLKKLGGLND